MTIGRRTLTINWRLLLTSLAVLVVASLVGFFWYQRSLKTVADALLTRAAQLEKSQDWDDAVTYYQRYLLLRPEDPAALSKLAESYGKGEPSPTRLSRHNSLLYRALGHSPARADLRLQIAENLLRLGAFDQAVKEAGQAVDDPKLQVKRRKILALANLSLARVNQANNLGDAIRELLAAADETPADVELAQAAAVALRSHSAAVPLDGVDVPARADQLMDQMVAANPRSVEARLARHGYRRQYRLEGADDDLQAALEINPDHVDALITSAVVVLSSSPASDAPTLEAAETQLRRAIELAPKDHRAYLALATLLEHRGDAKAAAELLAKGSKIAGDDLVLDLALVETQLRAADWPAVDQTLARLDERSALAWVQLDGRVRARFENRLKLAHARRELSRELAQDAMRKLRTIYLAEEGGAGAQHSPEWVQAARLLATIYGQKEDWDQAIDYWRVLVETLPHDARIIGEASQAMLQAGDPAAAIAVLDELPQTAEPVDALLVRRAEAHLALQLKRPPSERNWSEFKQALEAATSALGERVELTVCEAEFLASSDQTAQAAALIRTAEQGFADDVAFWRVAAQLYSRLGLVADRDRALERHKSLAASAAEHAVVEARVFAAGGQYGAAEQALASVSDLPSDAAIRLGRQRIEARALGGDLKGALELATSLIGQHPQDVRLLGLGLELTLATGDWERAKRWEAQLREVSPEDIDAAYWAVRRMTLTYDKLSAAEKAEVERQIDELRSARPRWFPAIALAAKHAELMGNDRQAVSDYQLAVDLGDRRPATLQQLTTLLYQFGEFEDAERVLSLLASSGRASDYVGVMSVELAARGERTERALEVAQQAIEQHPDDAARRLYLANLQLRLGESEEAIETLRAAVKLFPNDETVWNGLISALVRAGQRENARESIKALQANASIPAARRRLAAAQGYEAIGDVKAAAAQYEELLAEQSLEPLLHLRYAKLLSKYAPQDARAAYEKVLELDPANVAAKRDLAALLAATGEEANWARANELLTGMKDQGGNAADADRLRALLLSQKGRLRSERIANSQAARKILEGQIDTSAANSADLSRLLLAQILERESALSGDADLLAQAGAQLRTAAERGPSSSERWAQYIDFLLRHPHAEIQLSQADEGEAKASFLEEAAAAVQQLERLQISDDDQVTLMTAAYRARISKAQGNDEEARALIADFARDLTPPGEPTADQLLTIGKLYAAIGAYEEAEHWYRRLIATRPDASLLVVQALFNQGKRREAASFCLEAARGPLSPALAAALAFVLTEKEGTTPEEFPEADAALEAAVRTHASDLAVLQGAAVMHASRGQYDRAIKLFRSVLELQPNDELTLNNLATLLGEQPNQRAEALALVRRAIAIGGRKPALLDTEGTIHAKLGDGARAVACLEEATAGGAADARYYLHLAAAYRLAQRNDDARKMLVEARNFGLEKFVLTNDDRKLLTELEQALSPPGETNS